MAAESSRESSGEKGGPLTRMARFAVGALSRSNTNVRAKAPPRTKTFGYILTSEKTLACDFISINSVYSFPCSSRRNRRRQRLPCTVAWLTPRFEGCPLACPLLLPRPRVQGAVLVLSRTRGVQPDSPEAAHSRPLPGQQGKSCTSPMSPPIARREQHPRQII
jgi:hypothetical protein